MRRNGWWFYGSTVLLVALSVGASWFNGDALSRLSLWVTVGGLVVAFWQIDRNTSATEAASAAVRAALNSIVTHQLLAIVPTLRQAEAALDAAARGAPEAMAAALVEYRRVASEVRGILMRRPIDDQRLMTQLEDTISLAVVTKGRVSRDDADHQKAMSVMINKVSVVCDSLTSLAAFLVAEPTQGDSQ